MYKKENQCINWLTNASLQSENQLKKLSEPPRGRQELLKSDAMRVLTPKIDLV